MRLMNKMEDGMDRAIKGLAYVVPKWATRKIFTRKAITRVEKVIRPSAISFFASANACTPKFRIIAL